MGLNAGAIKQNKQEFVAQPMIDDGVYPARLVQIIDLGIQPQRAFKGETKKPQHEVMFTFELVDCFMVDKDGKDILDKPRWVSISIPLFPITADRAKSTKLANALDPNGVLNGNFPEMIGFALNVTLGSEKKGDKIYTNVLGFSNMRPRDAEKCPELVNPTKVFDLSEPDLEVFKLLPEWIQEKIKSNLGYKASKLQEVLGEAGEEPHKEEHKEPEEKAPEPSDVDEEDVPW